MTILDIILVIPLVWSLFGGFREGIVVQLGGLAGLFVGVWLAFRFGATIGLLVGMDAAAAPAVGFIIVVVATLIIIAILSRILRGFFRLAGLGILDKLGGSVLSFLKTGLILGILLSGFGFLNQTEKWLTDEELSDSYLYTPLTRAAGGFFPYMGRLVDVIKEEYEKINGPSGGEENPVRPETISTASSDNDKISREPEIIFSESSDEDGGETSTTESTLP